MVSRFALRKGALFSAALLRTSTPCAVAAPRLLHTSQQRRMPNILPVEGGKVRMGFIPEEWFQFFYEKTGVTGPYMFGTGLVLYCLNKELYIMGPETIHGVVALSLLVFAVKRFGPMLNTYVDKEIKNQLDTANSNKAEGLTGFAEAIEAEKKEQWRLDGRHYLFDAREENVVMQLEIEHRERLKKVTEDVKKRLDYQVELVNMKRRVEQSHMVRWIESNVIKSITPQQDKDILNKCILNLKTISTA